MSKRRFRKIMDFGEVVVDEGEKQQEAVKTKTTVGRDRGSQGV